MSDIFISYAHSSRSVAQGAAEALCNVGFSVFWDRDIEPGALWRSVLQTELSAAKVVVVFWCDESVVSQWVLEEADEARKTGTILPVQISQAEPPLGFREIQTLNLTSGIHTEIEFSKLIDATCRRIGRGPGNQSPESVPVRITSIFESMQPLWRPGLGDSLLLRPEERAVPFIGKAVDALAKFEDWALSDGRDHSLRLVAGVAGAGKTRLLLEVCYALRKRGWAAGFLSTTLNNNPRNQLSSWWQTPGPPRFVVVDYAEARPDDAIAVLETLLESRPQCKARIVLLARNTKSWWFDMLTRSKAVRALAEGSAFEETEWMDASNLSDTDDGAYVQALEAFSAILQCPAPSATYVSEPPDFLRETNGEPLYAHMAAMAVLRGDEPSSLSALLHATLLRERSFWNRLLSRARLDQAAYAPLFSQLVAIVTLLGGILSKESVFELIRDLLPGQDIALDVRLRLFALLYQAHPRGSVNVDALRPDRLGEALILEEVALHPGLLQIAIERCRQRVQAASTLAILERLAVRNSVGNLMLDPAVLEHAIDRLFRVVRPRTAEVLSRAMERRMRRVAGMSMNQVIPDEIQKALQSMNVQFELLTNTLGVADVYRRMKARLTSFSQIYDIFGTFVILESPLDCYRAMGIISARMKPLPGTFKDYIAIPSRHGYQALHQVYIGPLGLTITIRFMTRAMWTRTYQMPIRFLPSDA